MARTFPLIVLLSIVCAAAVAAEPLPLQSRPPQGQSASPSQTPAGIESCFGASGEKDEDLKTGNEDLVQQLLRQMLTPGS